ncbi:hypothetical protein AUC70_10725 [Methyloceanibacter stevinii]|uniref:Uncharacterized protein n=1 Tax=Methyloceanibacter stevinii TaxID=1774970 RepID=A0A1E3VKK8_9HYPH|nr:hypothetical protein AUC70_10725 [Methyloceanibacter stevinii]
MVRQKVQQLARSLERQSDQKLHDVFGRPVRENLPNGLLVPVADQLPQRLYGRIVRFVRGAFAFRHPFQIRSRLGLDHHSPRDYANV